jgi:protein-S-isoprenylcysteine O-methyltransferase Ste14
MDQPSQPNSPESGDLKNTPPSLTSLIARWRTRFSQLLSLAFILFVVFADKRLATEAPLATGLMFAAGCFLVGIAVVGRLWCAEYIAGRKSRTLVAYGPYSVCRNPLYFFSFLGGTGLGLCTKSIVLALVVIVAFAIIYPLTIANEERTLRNLFGKEYEDYLKKVPKFIPKLSLFTEPEEYVVKPRSFRREVGDALYFVWIIGLFAIIEALSKGDYLPILISVY